MMKSIKKLVPYDENQEPQERTEEINPITQESRNKQETTTLTVKSNLTVGENTETAPRNCNTDMLAALNQIKRQNNNQTNLPHDTKTTGSGVPAK